MKLLLKLVQKDFTRNKVITIALATFLMISAILMAGGLRVVGTMISSLNGLSRAAMPPEYLQMHKGTYDEKAFEKFVEDHDYIKDALIVNMLNINNSEIIYKEESLEKSLMDNGFVVQNEGFDLLLNTNNEVASVRPGEIGVPVYYTEELGIQVGDNITLKRGNYSKELKVVTIIRDATMNTALTSSKRFLINRVDLSEISTHMGEWEECFEFLLAEDATTATLQKDYMDADMASNGVAIPGTILIVMNAISYGLIAFIILIVSILLIVIAILCLSYIIRATMVEENYTIGEMKAMGFSRKNIENLYLIKYIILMIIAGIIGYLIAIPFGSFFSSSVVRYCGNGTQGWLKWVAPFIGIVLLSLAIMRSCRVNLRKNLKSTVVELMRGEENIRKEGRYKLPEKGLKQRNLTIALGELKCKWKEYMVIFLVFVFSSFLILLPMNMKHTIDNPSFITYMGVGECDIRIDMQYSELLNEQKKEMTSYLENDSDIQTYQIYANGYVAFENAKGQEEYMRIQNGDESAFPLEYLEGNAPIGKKEIALSYLNASELEKKVGDSLRVQYGGKEYNYAISGICQDITYGGKTAKAAVDFNEDDIEVYIVYLDVRAGVSIGKKTEELRTVIDNSKVTPVSEFVSQTLGGITKNMGMVEGVAIVISLLLSIIITVMFLHLIMAREHRAIAIKKAIGFSNRDIRIQLAIRIISIQFLAIVVGTILANSLGEGIFEMMLSSMGVARITLLVDPIRAYLICPTVQLIVVVITLIIGTKAVRNYQIRNQITE